MKLELNPGFGSLECSMASSRSHQHCCLRMHPLPRPPASPNHNRTSPSLSASKANVIVGSEDERDPFHTFTRALGPSVLGLLQDGNGDGSFSRFFLPPVPGEVWAHQHNKIVRVTGLWPTLTTDATFGGIRVWSAKSQLFGVCKRDESEPIGDA
ncbi:hypothetical protein ZHAS_00007481 [Anopheles sinensis]|uniref:Uncharacterized protein n=1 Tax=Anopheles sinensis TaxID=74873 RepID=A0A084VPX9_ANOSI|nr:hypothetical protein ZHAS_00007481 [Anopheles sinensis]